MGLYLRQNEDRTKLQQRLAEELREKAKARAKLEEARRDDIKDSAYMQNTKQTSQFAWLWALLVIGIVAAVIIFFIKTTNEA